MLLGACAGPSGPGLGASPAALTSASAPASPTGTSSAAPSPTSSPAQSVSPGPLARNVVVVLDPGHNGGNASNPGIINKQVPAGRGQTKPCNTTGTATNAGYT